jgi:hypothetical protein
MTTFDLHTLEQDRQVLTSILKRFGGKLALNATVMRGGLVRRGDEVELMAAEAGERPMKVEPVGCGDATCTSTGWSRGKTRS